MKLNIEYWFYLVNMLDIVLTFVFWDIEANPLVLNIGLLGFATVKVLSMFVWFMGWRFREANEVLKGVYE